MRRERKVVVNSFGILSSLLLVSMVVYATERASASSVSMFALKEVCKRLVWYAAAGAFIRREIAFEPVMANREPSVEHLAYANDPVYVMCGPNRTDGVPVDGMKYVKGNIKALENVVFYCWRCVGKLHTSPEVGSDPVIPEFEHSAVPW